MINPDTKKKGGPKPAQSNRPREVRWRPSEGRRGHATTQAPAHIPATLLTSPAPKAAQSRARTRPAFSGTDDAGEPSSAIQGRICAARADRHVPDAIGHRMRCRRCSLGSEGDRLTRLADYQDLIFEDAYYRVSTARQGRSGLGLGAEGCRALHPERRPLGARRRDCRG